MLGETIGNFRVVSRIGRGGMGEVYLAEQQNVGTRAAIKVLLPEVSEDGEHVQRLFNEARAVSRIRHAGIVKIFDVGTLPSGQAYLVMEHLDGESLARLIRRGTLPVARIADIGRQIASVLGATHAAGITHRDLKPDNVFLVPDHELASRIRVKVLDFGIAKLTGTLANASPRTHGTLGTPAYMAPEQWGDSSKVDWRADLYSLGCVAFEMACGRPPFVANNFAEACAKHLSEPPPRARSLAPELPAELDELLDQLLAKDPAARPATMDAVIAAFDEIGKHAPAAAPIALQIAPTVSPLANTVSTMATDETMPSDAQRASVVPAADHTVDPPSRARWLAVGMGGAALAGVVGFLALRGDDKAPVQTAAEPQVATTPVDAAPRPQILDAETAATPTDAAGPDVRQEISDFLEDHKKQMRPCFDRRVDKTKGGEIVINVALAANGRPTVMANGFDHAVAACIERVVKKLPFKAYGIELDVTYPVRFKAPAAAIGDGTLPLDTGSGSGGVADRAFIDATSNAGIALTQKRGQIRACGMDSPHDKVDIWVKVAPNGKMATIKIKPEVSAPVYACIFKLIRSIAFDKTAEGFSLSSPYELR